MTTGTERIKAAFARALETQSAAFMPYFTLGYPNRDESMAAVTQLAQNCDLLELGIPFSDPIADGPTIQVSTQKSLDEGTTVKQCLEMVRELRGNGVDTPAMLMGYYNPIMAYGIENYVRDAAEAGADGLIVPDLPPEESEELEAAAKKHGIAYIFFLAPTSDPERVTAVTSRADGFIYMVSVTGVTGERTQIRSGLDDFVRDVKAQTDVPIAVGFGIGTAEQAGEVGTFADGVIVGSAVIKAYDREKAEGVGAFAAELRGGLSK